MTIADLVELRLEAFAPEDRVRNWRMPEVEKLTAFSRAQIGRYVKAGELPAIKFAGAMREKTGQAGAIRFRLPEILRFIAEHERVGTGPIQKVKANKRAAGETAARRTGENLANGNSIPPDSGAGQETAADAG